MTNIKFDDWWDNYAVPNEVSHCHYYFKMAFEAGQKEVITRFMANPELLERFKSDIKSMTNGWQKDYDI